MMISRFLRLITISLLMTYLVACSADSSESAAVATSPIPSFDLDFVVLYRPNDPEMALRPAGIDKVPYNVATWLAAEGKLGDLKDVKRQESTQGDGFDDRILEGSSTERTADYFKSGELIYVTASQVEKTADGFNLTFPSNDLFELSATVVTQGEQYPLINYRIRSLREGFFSVGYMGAPETGMGDADEIWQPLIWQEQRIPDQSYLTLAYRTPLPTTMVGRDGRAYAVLAHPKELPFQPLPLASNSRFGVALRSNDDTLKPMIFAPVIGGQGSFMSENDVFDFSFYTIDVAASELTQAYEILARDVYGFSDYRRNDVASLNTALENITDYAMSHYARWISELKGSSYSTDVPGAVKNVSSLNALSLALVTDNPVIFEQRAYPLLEYMLSREKFLFSLDPEQKIQNPSRALKGPTAPISELAALYSILGRNNELFLESAKAELAGARIRNLDVPIKGQTWQNMLSLYLASGDETYLREAIAGADEYLDKRVYTPSTQFETGSFFWPAFVPDFVGLYRLYEHTDEKRFLDAARLAARHYTMFAWMAPKVPDADIRVNEGGMAPLYWYLKSKGHRPMAADEEVVPAWRLSEIGLTPESSGTSTGHRGIFMANPSPWLLRIGYDSGDDYLQEVAKASIVGRYSNFPGYHINTARTTVYEKADYPLREHIDLSVNSFHYNHIMPMAVMLLDYLVSDAYARSDGQIDFPAEFIEGYAYLQNRFYGHKPGSFYGEAGITMWMPPGLLKIDNPQLNYISGRRGDALFIAFMNQSDEQVSTLVHLESDRLGNVNGNSISLLTGQGSEEYGFVEDRSFNVTVPPNGLIALELKGIQAEVRLQNRLLAHGEPVKHDFVKIPVGDARAMLFDFGDLGRRLYVYLREDDSAFSSASLTYWSEDGKETVLQDESYPFEFTVPLGDGQKSISVSLAGIGVDGSAHKSETFSLGDKEP